jgi:hypothetical protein
MLKSRHWLLALAVCVPCLLLIAGDDADDRDPDTVEVDWEGWDDEDEDELIILDEPLQLEFFVDEGDGVRFEVVCASEDYRVSVDMGNQDGETHVEIGGTIQPLDDEGRLFLAFDATIHHANLVEGDELTFSAEGSTIVTLGQRTKLATFPGPSLSVTVSPVE